VQKFKQGFALRLHTQARSGVVEGNAVSPNIFGRK